MKRTTRILSLFLTLFFCSIYQSAGQYIVYYPPAYYPPAPGGCDGTDNLISIALDVNSNSSLGFNLLDENNQLLTEVLDSVGFVPGEYLFGICIPENGCYTLLFFPFGEGFNGTYTVELNGNLAALGGSFNTTQTIAGIDGGGCASLPSCNAYVSVFGGPVPGSPSACPPAPLTTPCPTFQWRYSATVTNLGENPIQAGSQLVIQLDGDMTYAGASSNPCNLTFVSYNATTDEVTFQTTADILPSNSCQIGIDVDVALTAVSPWTTTATFNAQCAAGTDDETDAVTETDACSCDPNDMQVSPAGCGPQGIIENQRLTYHIRFQNLGFGPAHDIVIRNPLDDDLDISTLKFLASSHPPTSFSIQPGNELVVTFLGIELPADIVDPVGSNGYVTYSIQPEAGLPDGTAIENYADIYFDANEPVTTNTVLNTIINGFTPLLVDLGPDRIVYPNDETANCAVLSSAVSGGVAPYAYEWNTGESAPEITVCPIAATTYIVSVTDASACDYASVDKITVFVDQEEEIQCGNNGNKVSVCHIPPGDPSNRHTICISPNALETHLAHGDYSGPCTEPHPSIVSLENEPGSFTPASSQAPTNLHAYPNPFSTSIAIEFYFRAPEEVKLDIFDVNGKLIRRLTTGAPPQGLHRFDWDGRDAGGAKLPNGLYVLRLRTADETVEGKVVLAR